MIEVKWMEFMRPHLYACGICGAITLGLLLVLLVAVKVMQ